MLILWSVLLDQLGMEQLCVCKLRTGKVERLVNQHDYGEMVLSQCVMQAPINMFLIEGRG